MLFPLLEIGLAGGGLLVGRNNAGKDANAALLRQMLLASCNGGHLVDERVVQTLCVHTSIS